MSDVSEIQMRVTTQSVGTDRKGGQRSLEKRKRRGIGTHNNLSALITSGISVFHWPLQFGVDGGSWAPSSESNSSKSPPSATSSSLNVTFLGDPTRTMTPSFQSSAEMDKRRAVLRLSLPVLLREAKELVVLALPAVEDDLFNLEVNDLREGTVRIGVSGRVTHSSEDEAVVIEAREGLCRWTGEDKIDGEEIDGVVSELKKSSPPAL